MKLVLCVERDNDIGRKLDKEGPIIGVEENKEVAEKLALKDPEDSDVNALFGGVRIAQDRDLEMAAITGDVEVGVVSDTELSSQLDEVIEDLDPESVVLVTDGAEDEEILPIVQSRIKIDSKETVIVRQSQELERAYFTITHFVQEISEDPSLARLVFGIPGLVLLLIAIGGALGMVTSSLLTILFISGFYLVIKCLGYEEKFFSKISDFLKSLSLERISILTYSLSLIILIISLGYIYEGFVAKNPVGIVDSLATILTLDSTNLLVLAFVLAILGKIIDDFGLERYLNIRRDVIFMSFILLLFFMFQSAANYWKKGTLGNFVFSAILGILLFALVIKLTEYIFMEEIQARERLLNKYSGKKVYSRKGRELGKVSQVLLECSKFLGIEVEGEEFSKDDIVPSEEEPKRIFVKT